MRSAGAVVVGCIGAHRSTGNAVLAKGDAGSQSFFGECPVAIISIEFVGLSVVGDEDVRPGVAVVIKDGNAQRFAGSIAEAGPVGDVFELSAAQIMEQPRLVSL